MVSTQAHLISPDVAGTVCNILSFLPSAIFTGAHVGQLVCQLALTWSCNGRWVDMYSIWLVPDCTCNAPYKLDALRKIRPHA